MSRDQRVRDNHALLAAQELAIEQNVPLYVLFVLKKTGYRSREHYQFMIEGLKQVSEALRSKNIPFILRIGNSHQEIIDCTKEVGATSLFFDFSPLHGARSLIKRVAAGFDGSVTVVDTHNIIPVWVTSDKQEFAAHTIRNKIHQKLASFLVAPQALKTQVVTPAPVFSNTFEEAEAFTGGLLGCGISVGFKSGEAHALHKLEYFIDHVLEVYAQGRNDIAQDLQSGLSPYLHFGQISSLRVVINVIDAVSAQPLLLREAKLAQSGPTPSAVDGMNALLEEMVVRKELADNFCFYSDDYKTLLAAPDWARQSLQAHVHDTRDFTYSIQAWEAAATHDEVWNAAQTELAKTGKIHGYMRMYWAKKILEWSITPQEALQTAIYLNDKYSLDGGDPNGYVGILWSIAGLHDRPWFERPVYGKIRYMNEAGLRRKFAVDTYIKRVNLQK